MLPVRLGLQEGVGHGFQSQPGHVLGEVIQGLAVDGGGLTEGCGHPLKATTRPCVCKTGGTRGTRAFDLSTVKDRDWFNTLDTEVEESMTQQY